MNELTKELKEIECVNNWKELVYLKGFKRPYIPREYYRATIETIELLALGYFEETAIELIIKRREADGKKLDFKKLEEIVEEQLRFASWQKMSEDGRELEDKYKEILRRGMDTCLIRVDEEAEGEL